MELKDVAERYLNARVTHAVITVPAYFLQSQKEATRTAAEIAGFQVLQLINEPTAAALYYGFLNRAVKTTENLFVFDLGGGTLDVSIVQRTQGDNFRVICSFGNAHHGGNDIDDLLVDHLLVEFSTSSKLKIDMAGAEGGSFFFVVSLLTDFFAV